MNQVLRDHLLAVQEGLRASFQIAKTHQHKGLIGTCREQFVQQFLAQHLPSHYEILTGEIVDSDGLVSPQQDIIIHNPTIPKMTTSPLTNVVLAEGAIVSIEVKSQLKSEKEIIEVFDEIVHVKKLKKEKAVGFYRPTALEEKGNAWEDNAIRSVIVAFESGSIDLFLRTIETYYAKAMPQDCVDLIVLLDRGVIGKGDGFIFNPHPEWKPPPPPTPISVIYEKDDDNRLIYLYMYLFRILTRYGIGSTFELRSHVID